VFFSTDPVCMGLATGLTLSDVSVAGLLGISESSSYSLGSGSGVCCCTKEKKKLFHITKKCVALQEGY